MIKKITENKYTSAIIPVLCIPIQIITLVALSPKLAIPANEFQAKISPIFSMIWGLLPLLGLFGAYSGIAILRRNGFQIIAVTGIALNILWVLIFSVFWLLIAFGISV